MPSCRMARGGQWWAEHRLRRAVHRARAGGQLHAGIQPCPLRSAPVNPPAVGLLSYDYPPNDGGISRLTAATAVEMARRGISVEVLTLAGSHFPGPERPPLPTREVRRT